MLRLLPFLLLPVLARAQGEIGYDQIVVVTAAVENYDGWDDLPGAKRDVELFQKALVGPWDAPVQVIHLDDSTASREGILEAIDQAATEAGKQPRSLLIFYFAGHGETYKGKGYIVPAGAKKGAFATWLSIDELKAASEGARAVPHQLFILGSCFGGTLIQRSSDRSVQELTEAETMAKWRQTELANTARVALAAGNDKQLLPDGGAQKGSTFGRALAAALRWSAKGRAADYNNDGCVDRYELAAYVSAHGKTASNSPRMGPLPDDDAGILALCKGRFDEPPKLSPFSPRRGNDPVGETPERPGLVHIPAGRFTMGSPVGEPGREGDETAHPVTLTRPFLMMRTEVTQGQWHKVMGNNPSGFPACGPTCPVEQVNWFEAASYANALSKSEALPACYTLRGCKGTAGKDLACDDADLVPGCNGYRLPTEAEWEYAARAGTQTALYTGPLTIKGQYHGPELDPIAWYGGNSGVGYAGARDCKPNDGWKDKQYPEQKTCGTHPVAGRRPNAWGLYDMLGNVWEWTGDWYADYDPAIDSDPSGPASGRFRVFRGGSWYSLAGWVRAANRLGRHPGVRNRSQGFRLVRRP